MLTYLQLASNHMELLGWYSLSHNPWQQNSRQMCWNMELVVNNPRTLLYSCFQILAPGLPLLYCCCTYHQCCCRGICSGLWLQWVYMKLSCMMVNIIRESVDFLCRDGADAQYMQYLRKSCITSYNYHHSNKLYRKISWVCCRLYCYKCTARVTMPTATNKWYFFRYSLVLVISDTDFVISDTDFHVTCSTNTDSCVTCSKKYSFYKLHAAARLPHWLQYIHVS